MGELEKDIAAAVAQATGTPPAPEPARVATVGGDRSARRPLAWYGGVALASATVLVGAGFLTASLVSPDSKRNEARAETRSEIRIGRVDLPDLKDGVPQLASATATIRTVPLAPATTGSIAPSSGSPFAGAPTGPTRNDAASQTASAGEPTIRSLVTAPAASVPVAAPLPVIRSTAVAAPVVQPPAKTVAPAPAPQVVASVSAAPVPMPPARVAPPRVVAAIDVPAAPLPPTAPARSAGLAAPIVRAKPPVVAAAPRPKPATIVAENPADPTTTATLGARKPAQEEEHYDVLGLKVPTIGTTANRIRDGVSAIGDAVTSLPDRF